MKPRILPFQFVFHRVREEFQQNSGESSIISIGFQSGGGRNSIGREEFRESSHRFEESPEPNHSGRRSSFCRKNTTLSGARRRLKDEEPEFIGFLASQLLPHAVKGIQSLLGGHIQCKLSCLGRFRDGVVSRNILF